METVHSFSSKDGYSANSKLILASDGNYYGTTLGGGTYAAGFVAGTLFRLTPTGQSTVVHSFPDRSFPTGGVIQASDGNLYGVLSEGGLGGQVYRYSLDGTYEVIYSFHYNIGLQDRQPERPSGRLVEGPDGAFYGLTSLGGAADMGTAYRLTKAGEFTLLHEFTGADGYEPHGALVLGTDGLMYGCTSAYGDVYGAIIFSLSPAGKFRTVAKLPSSYLYEVCGELVLASDGKLYGTSSRPARLFSVTNEGVFTVLQTLPYAEVDGVNDGLVEGPDHALYGTTTDDYDDLKGSLIRFTTAGELTTLHHFTREEGSIPQAGVLITPAGELLGTVGYYGEGNSGMVYRYAQGKYARACVFNFQPLSPLSGLVAGSDGLLYGAAAMASNGVALYSLSPNGTFTVLHILPAGTGSVPPLVEGANGALYGTTRPVDTGMKATVFRLAKDGTFSVVHDWPGSIDGSRASLLAGSDGNLYGTTQFGGNDQGSLFRLGLDGTFTEIHSFDALEEGGYPNVGLTEWNGRLYGVLNAATGGRGSIFAANLDGTVSVLARFSETGIAGLGAPNVPLSASAMGLLGGTAFSSGYPGANGTFFSCGLTGGLTLLHALGASEGYQLAGPVWPLPDGSLLAVTRGSSTYPQTAHGTIVRLTRDGQSTKIADLNSPTGGLTQGSDGKLYGADAGGGANGTGRIFRLSLVPSLGELSSTTPDPQNPSPVAGTATARLSATITGFGSTIVAHFEYGPDATYGFATPPVSLGAVTTPITFGAGLEGLALAQTWHYRLVAEYDGTKITSADASFHTPPRAVNDTAATVRERAVTIEPLANDSAAAGLSLTLTGVAAPAHGQTIIAGTAFIYLPAPGFVGTDTFAYHAHDSAGGVSTASITVQVTNPLASAAGTYTPLLTRFDAVPQGQMRITVSEMGAFTAVLNQAGWPPLSLRGTFGADGAAHVSSGPYQVDLRLDLHAAIPAVSGTITRGYFQTTIESGTAIGADRPSAPMRFTFVTPAPAAESSPLGDGFGTAVINRSGVASIIGRLCDGTAYSAAVPWHRDHSTPFYASLNGGRGAMQAEMILDEAAASSVTPAGRIHWVRKTMPGQIDYVLYPYLSPYHAPAAGERMLTFTSDPVADVNLGTSVPAAFFELHFDAHDAGRANRAPGDSLWLSWNRANGTFTGFRNLRGVHTYFAGAVLQNGGAAFGRVQGGGVIELFAK